MGLRIEGLEFRVSGLGIRSRTVQDVSDFVMALAAWSCRTTQSLRS